MHPRVSIALATLIGTSLSGLCVRRAAAAANADDACALLTTSQVSAAIETQVDAGRPVNPNNPRGCIWLERGKREGAGRNVTAGVLDAQLFERRKKPLPGVPTEPASGIGDEPTACR
jgi:hypothetical protein